MKFILFCVTLDLSDNLTEMGIMKNSNILVLYHWLQCQQLCLHVTRSTHEGKGSSAFLKL